MRKGLLVCLFAALVFAAIPASADTITFTAADVANIMAGYGAPLSDATYQWGLWAVRVMPIVTGGGYTIAGGSTTQAGWGVSAPNGIFGASPYGAANSVWFWDASGAEAAGTPANPLYMIMNQPADTFRSSSFDGSGNWVSDYYPGGPYPFYASGYDGGAGGTNLITAVDDSAQFTFSFTLDAGAMLAGWQFVVDGSKYTVGTSSAPGTWVADFFGGYGTGGGLASNMGSGYAVPEPASLLLLGTGLVGLAGAVRRRMKMKT